MNFLISDFAYDEIPGGAEYVDRYFLKNIDDCNFLKCLDFDKKKFSKDDHYIISNFASLNEEVKQLLINNGNYVIVEHDYKFLAERNPIKYPNYKVPKEKIINEEFYNSAKAVFAQSGFHSKILKDNLPKANIKSFSTTFYEESHLKLLESIANKKVDKNKKFAIVYSTVANKGMYEAESYCKKNNIEYDVIPRMSYEKFLNALSSYEGLVFFPQSPETFCKLLYEAKVLGLKIKTNKNSGFVNEKWVGDENLLEYIRNKQNDNIQMVMRDLGITN